MRKIFALFLAAMLLMILTMPTVLAEAARQSPVPVIDLTPLFQAVIALLAALITGRLLPWIKIRTNETQRERLMAVIRTLVYAAQQLYSNGEIQDRLDYVEEALLDRGFEVDRDAIEAAVKELKLADGLFIAQEGIAYEGGTDDE